MAGFNEFRNDRFDQAIGNYRIAIDAAEKLDRGGPLTARTLNDLARVFVAKGEFRSALYSYKEASELPLARGMSGSEVSEFMPIRCEAFAGMANSLNCLGNEKEAESYFLKAMNEAKTDKLVVQLRSVSFQYGAFLRQHGQADKASSLAEQEQPEEQDSEPLPQGEAQATYQMDSRLNLGDQAIAHLDYLKADGQYKLALHDAEQSKQPIAIANCASRLGQLALRQGNWDLARTRFDYALRYYYEGHADTVTRRAAVSGLALSLHKLKNYPQAEFCANQLIADSLRIRSKDGHEMREGLEELVGIYQDSGQTGKAIVPMVAILKNYRQYGPITMPGPTMMSCYLANQYWMLGFKDKTQQTVDDFVAQASESSPEALLLPGRLMDDYAEVLEKSKAKDEAQIFVHAAQKLLKKAANSKKEWQRNKNLETQAR